jgi:hypothetical protein
MLLLPWFLMYGISAIPFAHNRLFEERDRASGVPLWTVRFERPMEAVIPEGRDAQREFGRRVLSELGITAPNFGVYSPNRNTLQVSAFSFLKTTRAVYREDRRTVSVEDRRFRFDQFLTGMHARGGFVQDGVLSTLWAVMVDLVSLAFITWVITGWLMWWRITSTRIWGSVALIAGALSFAVFTLGL